MIRLVLSAIMVLLLPLVAAAQDTIRIATFNASLTRSGPGVLINRLAEGGDDQIKAVAEIIRTVRPDILLINEFDHDPVGLAADLMVEILGQPGPDTKGIDYPHTFDPPPNTGYLSGFDLNDDGKVAGPADAFGYGKFPGQYGMLLLSRFPIDVAAARDFSTLLWKDLPDARLPYRSDGSLFPSEDAFDVIRLSSKGHWDVPIDTPHGRIHLLASHPTPPVFDGPQDFNGKRNADEITFWIKYIDGVEFEDKAGLRAALPSHPFVVAGDLNADPNDGDGIRQAITDLLGHRAVQDPKPSSKGGTDAALLQGGRNSGQAGDPAQDTADWNDQQGPGNLRVDFVLPSSHLEVVDAGVFWPTRTDPDFALIGSGKPVSSDHRLVWVDVIRQHP